MAALTRATKANYVIHDRIEAETTDREDHTFCGIMFPVRCKDTLPIDHVVINSVAVRGALGPLTVWVTKEAVNGEISMSKKHWTKVYEKTHKPSFASYKELEFASNPVIMRPGQVRGMYIHSTLRGDEAIVYDNKQKQKTHDDSFITILPGRAHVSERAFGSVPIWGWGSAWRDNREFVGQIKYGAVYRLWNPSSNLSFGGNFRSAARILFLCQRRVESPFSKLPDDCLFYILNMMRWDWLDDTSCAMRREQKRRRRLERGREQQLEQQRMVDAERGAPAHAMEGDMEEEVSGEVVEEDRDTDAVLGVDDEEGDDGMDDEEGDDGMDEDSSDDEEDADSSDDDSGVESAASDEYAWGDHVSSRNQFVYQDYESTDSDDDSEEEEEGVGRRRRFVMMRARRSIYQFLRHH
eukprot:CAMPEP_0196134322 /NCGR_PEP_ID=MMETSP0910-20130528/3258_1 /TAXON_ID=49265 /ORGANISM="Thalassiosira rotula, Strain GSO102" /LENGTH=408 /DNA_ID=CAMNT_0041394219 /DNA_START=202 /DNA_END=1428 /DNA_ORIENTATION=+